MHVSYCWGKQPTLFPEISHLFPGRPRKAGWGVYTSGQWGQVTRLEIPGHEQSGVNSPVPTWAVSLFQLLSWPSWDPTVSWCWGEGSCWLVGIAVSRRTWEKLWISDPPPQGSAPLSSPQSSWVQGVCVAGMGSGTLCSDLAIGTHSALGTASVLAFTICFLCGAHVGIPRESPWAHAGDQGQAVTARWHCELAGTAVILTSPQGGRKAQSNSSCSSSWGCNSAAAVIFHPDLWEPEVFQSHRAALLIRVQGGKTQDTTQASDLQFCLQL